MANSVFVSNSTKKTLRALAHVQGISQKAIVQQAVKVYIEQLKSSNDRQKKLFSLGKDFHAF